MEGPTTTTQKDKVAANRKYFENYVADTNRDLGALKTGTGNDPAIQNTCNFIERLNRIAELYAQADDGPGAKAMALAGRHMLRYAEGAANGLKRSGQDSLQFYADLATHPAETLAKLKEGTKALTILTAKMILIGNMFEENPELAMETANTHLKPVLKPMIDKLEAMTGPERTELIFYGLGNFVSGKYLFTGLEASLGTTLPAIADLKVAITTVSELGNGLISELEIANSSSSFAGLPSEIKSLKTPITTMSENLGKFRLIAQQKGQEFVKKIAAALQQNPELVEIEGSFDGAVARITGDIEKESASTGAAAAAGDTGSFRRGDRGTGGGSGSGGVQISDNPVKMFEQRISKMPVGERVAAVRTEAERIAQARGWNVAPEKIRKGNKGRTIYWDETTETLYSVDTQHGRFEVCEPKKGKHLMEVDFDLNQTKPADTSGRHDLIV